MKWIFAWYYAIKVLTYSQVVKIILASKIHPLLPYCLNKFIEKRLSIACGQLDKWRNRL